MNAIRIFCCGSSVPCMTKSYRPASASGSSLTKFSPELDRLQRLADYGRHVHVPDEQQDGGVAVTPHGYRKS
jgi:hypothetical protein